MGKVLTVQALGTRVRSPESLKKSWAWWPVFVIPLLGIIRTHWTASLATIVSAS